MSGGRVYRVQGWGWVAADDSGWTDKVYETEEEARAAVGLPPKEEDDEPLR